MLPWDHLDSGLDKEWLWEDWQDALDEFEQDDCRWTPCFDCGVCPQMGTDIQIGPTGRPCCRSPSLGRARAMAEHTMPDRGGDAGIRRVWRRPPNTGCRARR